MLLPVLYHNVSIFVGTKPKTSPYFPSFGKFLNSGNTSLIGEPIDWEGA